MIGQKHCFDMCLGEMLLSYCWSDIVWGGVMFPFPKGYQFKERSLFYNLCGLLPTQIQTINFPALTLASLTALTTRPTQGQNHLTHICTSLIH